MITSPLRRLSEQKSSAGLQHAWWWAWGITSALTILAIVIAGLTVTLHPSSSHSPSSSRERAIADASLRTDVGIQLFQWPWTSIAKECESTLGPSGIRRVLISPPQESLRIPTWTASYAPVSYRLESPLGTEAEFAAMVSRCARQGVDIIADAVMNHMAPAIPPYRGWASSAFSAFTYPDYGPDHFHHCPYTPDGVMHTYADRRQVQDCAALGLPDLDHRNPHVTQTLHRYLGHLRHLGVKGFRIDAAKHIPAEDIGRILAPLPPSLFVVQEVIPGVNEPITPEEYTPQGRVFDFMTAVAIAHMIRNGDASELRARPTISAQRRVPFVANHDTERDVPHLLNYRDGWDYTMGSLLLLAIADDSPFLYSGYDFRTREESAPASPDGHILPVHCASSLGEAHHGDFLCAHRSPAIQHMLRWRGQVLRALTSCDHHCQETAILESATILWSLHGVLVLRRGDHLFALNTTSSPVIIPGALPPLGKTMHYLSLRQNKPLSPTRHALLEDSLTIPSRDVVISITRPLSAT